MGDLSGHGRPGRAVRPEPRDRYPFYSTPRSSPSRRLYDPPATPTVFVVGRSGRVEFSTYGFSKDDVNEVARRIAFSIGAEPQMIAESGGWEAGFQARLRPQTLCVRVDVRLDRRFRCQSFNCVLTLLQTRLPSTAGNRKIAVDEVRVPRRPPRKPQLDEWTITRQQDTREVIEWLS